MKEIKVKYPMGHSHTEIWDKNDLFCPNCGGKPVWNEQGPGDYYVGEQYICLKCGYSFTIQEGDVDAQRFELLTGKKPRNSLPDVS